jgi:hypothetical protein
VSFVGGGGSQEGNPEDVHVLKVTDSAERNPNLGNLETERGRKDSAEDRSDLR